MRKQDRIVCRDRDRAAWWQALKSVPGGWPLMAFFLLSLTAGAAYFTAMALFCLQQGDLLWTAFALSFSLLFTATEALGLASALLRERYPRFYRFMWECR